MNNMATIKKVINKFFVLIYMISFCGMIHADDFGNVLLDNKRLEGSGALDIGNLDFKVKAEKHDKLKVKLVFVGKNSKKLDDLLKIIANNLEFSGQFDVKICYSTSLVSKKEDIVKYFTPDCRLGIFLNAEDDKNFAWRIYDLEYAQMVKGEKYAVKGNDLRCWAHNLSDAIWPSLTGESGFFSTKIVYSKKVNKSKKRDCKHIYVADYNGQNEQLLVGDPTVVDVAPRWNNDPKNPLVFYSEHTNRNVRLMVVDMHKRRQVASNFNGLNILSTFSPDGKRFAYCASKGNGLCNVYFYDGKLKKITNSGNNIAPTFADNGKTLYFCSDANSKFPQIYKYDLSKMDNSNYKPECIAKDGFYVATVFNNKKNLLAYSKMVSGIMQIFVYNPANNTHKQVSFGAGNKEECSWSPCGNYLLFSVETNNKSRLAIQNLLTGKMVFITKPKDSCYYPFWSPVYENIPVVA